MQKCEKMVKQEMKILLHGTQLRVSMFIVLALCQVSTSHKPILFPNIGVIVIEEGETLNITCTGHTPIHFHYPSSYGKLINSSNVRIQVRDENGIYNYVFQRLNTVLGDTGWYGCADNNVEIDTNSYNSEVNWLYVYVKSNTSLFVENDINAQLSAVAGGSIVIPCRTTSPDLKPILINGNEDELNEVSFDPQIGFTIRNLQMKDSNSYKCLIKKDNKQYEINYVLLVHLNRTLPNPMIQVNSMFFTFGDDLYMNCSIEIETSMRYVFEWNTPQNNSRRSFQQLRKWLAGNTVLVISQLMIFNITFKDTGNYECVIRTIHGIKKVTKNIYVYDNYFKPLKVFPTSNITYYRKESGSEVEWICMSFGHLRLLQWFKPNGEEIVKSPKYFLMNKQLNTTFTSNMILYKFGKPFRPSKHLYSPVTIIFLKIVSLNIMDSGNYTLQVKSEMYDLITEINFTLDVIANPISTLMYIYSYYPLNQSTIFGCEVTSNPPPNITWRFLKCPNYPSLENSTIVHLTDVTQSTIYNSNYGFQSIVKMLIEVSGKVTCEACNDLACDSKTERILVSDGLDAFGIIGPKEPVVKGDNIELVCAASVYNYTNEFTWTVLVNRTEESLVETDRLKIVQHETSFTYRSTLKLNNVQESDAQNYFCTGQIMNTSNYEIFDPLSDNANYKLVIYDPILPFFVKTNMNETKIRDIDEITEGHITVILQCFAEGMPKPTVTWHKDDVLLKENNQYLFKYNHQELHIKHLMEHDSGKYLCRAISRLGTNETYQQITVTKTKWHTLNTILVTAIPILCFILIILAFFFTIKIHREKKMRRALMEEKIDGAGLMHFEEGTLQCLNPNLTVDDQAELLPYDKKWEFPRERLKLKEQLGSGHFGVVMKAEAFGICKNENVTTVAVKMVRRTTNATYIRALASELKIMVHLGKHLNVVNLLGACTKNISKCKLLVLVEYCRFGNLHNYLLRHRNNFINQINPKTGKFDFTIGMDVLTGTVGVSNTNSLIANSDIGVEVHYRPGNPVSPEINFLPDCVLSSNLSQPGWRLNHYGDYKDQNRKPLCTQDLLSWAFQVARGMEYLSQRKVLHGDLAARNILLAEDNVVKICDFGLAKSMYKDDNYMKKGDTPMPIKWMAIESIRDRVFSTQSDIWSFGIMLWEFFTLAETPYPGMEIEKLYQKLIDGYRMKQPDYAVREVYDIMLQCWDIIPTSRPNFIDLVEKVGNFLEECVRLHYINLNRPYMDMNTINLKSGKNDYLTMMSAPDHAVLSLLGQYCVNSPKSDSSSLCIPGCSKDESEIFSSRTRLDHPHIEISSPALDSENAVELPPVLKHEEDPYLKPINVHERREEFVQQELAMKDQTLDRQIDHDSEYYNTPPNSPNRSKRHEQE